MFNIVLVEPEIPPNTGNVARLCAALNYTLHIVEPVGFDMSDRALKRAGVDYWEHVKWEKWPDFKTLREKFPESTFWLFTTKSKRPYTCATYKPGDFLVFGRETRGLPEPILSRYPDACLTIPMPNPAIRSLNLATSAAIVAYEALRQNSHPTPDTTSMSNACLNQERNPAGKS